jgi:hypothetical protein
MEKGLVTAGETAMFFQQFSKSDKFGRTVSRQAMSEQYPDEQGEKQTDRRYASNEQTKEMLINMRGGVTGLTRWIS